MPHLGTGSIDIQAIKNAVLHFLKSRANQANVAPCDNWILRLHYRGTFCLFLGIFLGVWYRWYHGKTIVCASKYNAETPVKADYENICLSYPYIEEDGDKRYILYYRWIPYASLFFAVAYYTPRKLSKNIENPRLKKLFEDLSNNAFRYDSSGKELFQRTVSYLAFNLKTHNNIYCRSIFVIAYSLILDILMIDFLDYLLQGRFLLLGFTAFPFSRDPETFTDYVSRTFPPFVLCQIGSDHEIVGGRVELLGCHLTVMELYEKLFILMWFWLFLLTFATATYLVFQLFLLVPKWQSHILKMPLPAHSVLEIDQVMKDVLKNCCIGDIYILYRLKHLISTPQYIEILALLGKQELLSKPYTIGMHHTQLQTQHSLSPKFVKNDYTKSESHDVRFSKSNAMTGSQWLIDPRLSNSRANYRGRNTNGHINSNFEV